jgi:DNA polymerase II small subunit
MVSVQQLAKQGVFFDPDVDMAALDETLLDRVVERYGEDLMVIDSAMLEACVQPAATGQVKVVWSYDQEPRKRTYDDFVKSLQLRFRELERLLKGRQEMANTTSLSRIRAKRDRENVACIGMVVDKGETAGGNIMLTIEDFTAQIKVLVTEKRRELFELAREVQFDEVIGITGSGSGEIIFADNIIIPDIPLTKELRKSPLDEYAIFVGDPHFGSKAFLKEDFLRFIEWINGRAGNDEQRAIAAKVRYVFITGDLIEGVGVYPGQEHDLAIMDITEQYEEAARHLSLLPQDKQLILFTGNHDAGRLSEPQEPMLKTYAQPLYDLPNVTIVSNPAVVNIGATDSFPGLDCLLYHGGSFIYYADSIPAIRAAGGQKRADLIMKYLLQRRHLAPTHNAAMTIPTTDRDWLLIDRVPDLFVSGHIHRVSVSDYRNVTCINAGCWTETTEDQVKRGLEPQPSKLILLSLRTRAVKVMNFKKERKVAQRGSEAAKKQQMEATG